MIVPFTPRSRLLSAVDRLALYNYKGIAWSKHTEEQAQAERAQVVAKIQTLVSKLGESNLPPEFVASLRSGTLATDLTGRYVDVLKRHFRASPRSRNERSELRD